MAMVLLETGLMTARNLIYADRGDASHIGFAACQTSEEDRRSSNLGL